MNSPAIHDGSKVGGNLKLGKWKERWELEQEGLHVCFSPTLKPRSRGEKAPGRKAGMTETKVVTIATLWQRWVTVHKLECVRDTELANSLFRFFHAM